MVRTLCFLFPQTELLIQNIANCFSYKLRKQKNFNFVFLQNGYMQKNRIIGTSCLYASRLLAFYASASATESIWARFRQTWGSLCYSKLPIPTCLQVPLILSILSKQTLQYCGTIQRVRFLPLPYHFLLAKSSFICRLLGKTHVAHPPDDTRPHFFET